MDQIAAKGTNLQNFTVDYPICSPSSVLESPPEAQFLDEAFPVRWSFTANDDLRKLPSNGLIEVGTDPEAVRSLRKKQLPLLIIKGRLRPPPKARTEQTVPSGGSPTVPYGSPSGVLRFVTP